ncbi:5-methyltetrahydrofolate--homocysteine methyltransferase [Agaribacter marinus]|uniref:5-methyltetrahydrofolate--homocysteine methyltransferase n=1 Tax=Agaribacter marinus TaxID=1431249 RepID=A0AA37SX50_9ALTE|nr:5-methyltetrahydrofolate--homocysteine methyltransferase [Agaribacter marinus]GLR71428.1 hypothetical protein GCM10007852_23360 [Agaribacter marinus]
MNAFIQNKKPLSLITLAILGALLSGCSGDAETIIIEREPIVEDDHDDGHDHSGEPGGGGDITIESLGRIAVLSSEASALAIMDIDDGAMLDEFSLSDSSAALYASPDNRYAVISMRSMDTTDFIDGGLWREDHTDHLHDYKQAPQMSDFSVNGSRPTHIGTYDGQMTIFYDGDAEAGVPAGVKVLTDENIAAESDTLPTLEFTMNMHGVAKSRGDILVSTVRREDSESTSNAKILPDQVGIYHWHDGEYQLEQVLATPCPDLHGAAENEDYIAFGCGDSVLVTHQHDDEFESVKIDNIAEIDGLRVGTIYGHENSALFFGIASSRATDERAMVSINPENNTMKIVEWRSEAGADPVAYSFSGDGDTFVILDNLGFVAKYVLHEHNGELEFEFESAIGVSNEDISAMPEGHNFSMTMSQNDEHLYIADPIAQHILQIDLTEMSIEDDIELDIIPSRLVWLGIAKTSDHNSDDHD